MAEPILRVVDVAKTYPTAQGPLPVLRGVSLALAPGASLALTGEIGSGKSTLLHLVAGLDAVDARRGLRRPGAAVRALGDAGARGAAPRGDRAGVPAVQPDPEPRRRRQPRLPGAARRPPRRALVRRAGRSGSGSTGCWTATPSSCRAGSSSGWRSGGRSPARPRLILADEPTGNLDEATGDAVLGLMLELVRRGGAALLMVTHSRAARGAARRAAARLHGGRLA